MSDKRPDGDPLALQFYRAQKNAVDLIRARPPRSGFELAIYRLFGKSPKRDTTVVVGKQKLSCISLAPNRVSFVPLSWKTEFDKLSDRWAGCENWWAGYPLISYVDLRAGDDGRSGRLILKAEVGPISVPAVRKAVIETVESAARAGKFNRVQFPDNATDDGKLYSLFLRNNTLNVVDIHSGSEVEQKILLLISDFEPELDLIGKTIPHLPLCEL